MTEHAVVIAGGGPTGLTLGGELALAGVDVAIVERRPNQELAGSRAGGLSSRTLEVFDQRGIVDRFLAEGQIAQVTGFAVMRLDIFTLLQDARPVLLNLGAPGSFDITPWSDRVKLVYAKYDGPWELPALGLVSAPTTVLIRPDGYVAWVGDRTQDGLQDAMNSWFGPPG